MISFHKITFKYTDTYVNIIQDFIWEQKSRLRIKELKKNHNYVLFPDESDGDELEEDEVTDTQESDGDGGDDDLTDLEEESDGAEAIDFDGDGDDNLGFDGEELNFDKLQQLAEEDERQRKLVKKKGSKQVYCIQ